MRNIILIAETELRDYAVDIFSRHPNFNGKITGIIEWNTKRLVGGSFRARLAKLSALIKQYPSSIVKNAKLNNPCANSILIVGRNRQNILEMLYKIILSPKKSKRAREILFVDSSCAVQHMDFINGNNNDFDPVHVKTLPDSIAAFSIATKMLDKVISPNHAAKKTHRTDDGIEAYKIENLFVKISEDGLISSTYISDGKVLNECVNSTRCFMYDKCIELASSTEADVIYNEKVCVLTRFYSSISCYHFLYEVLDKILIAEDLGYKGKYMLFFSDYASQLLALSGISSERFIWIKPSDAGKIFLIKNAFEIEGFTLSSQKGLSRLNAFSDNLATVLTQEKYPERIYLNTQGQSNEVEALIKKYNFYSLNIGEHSWQEIIKFFSHAEIILSPDCPQLSNVLFARRNTKIIELFPFNQGTIFLKDVMTSRELIYYSTTIKTLEEIINSSLA